MVRSNPVPGFDDAPEPDRSDDSNPAYRNVVPDPTTASPAPATTTPTPAPPSDAELLLRAQGADVASIGTLFGRHHEAIRRFAEQVTAGDDDPHRLIARTEGRLHAVLPGSADLTIPFRAYALRTLALIAGAGPFAVDDQATPERLDDSALAGAFRSLPDRWKLALWHTTVEGESTAAVALLLGVGATEVDRLTERARDSLRQTHRLRCLDEADIGDCQLVLHAAGSSEPSGLTATVDRDGHVADCARCTAALATQAGLTDDLAGTLAILVLGPSGREYLRRRRDASTVVAASAAGTGEAALAGVAGVAVTSGGGGSVEPTTAGAPATGPAPAPAYAADTGAGAGADAGADLAAASAVEPAGTPPRSSTPAVGAAAGTSVAAAASSASAPLTAAEPDAPTADESPRRHRRSGAAIVALATSVGTVVAAGWHRTVAAAGGPVRAAALAGGGVAIAAFAIGVVNLSNGDDVDGKLTTGQIDGRSAPKLHAGEGEEPATLGTGDAAAGRLQSDSASVPLWMQDPARVPAFLMAPTAFDTASPTADGSRPPSVGPTLPVPGGESPGQPGPDSPTTGPTRPGPTDPGPTDPDPTDPDPTDPEPTDAPEPTSTELPSPDPTDPDPTEPEPTSPDDPGPTEPEPEPTTNDPEPTTNDPEPTSSDPEPTSADPEPTSADPEPTSADPEPTDESTGGTPQQR